MKHTWRIIVSCLSITLLLTVYFWWNLQNKYYDENYETVLKVSHMDTLKHPDYTAQHGMNVSEMSTLLKLFPKEHSGRFEEYQLNVSLSDSLPLYRSIPDTRPPMCSHQRYHSHLPQVCFLSIVTWASSISK